MIFIETVQSKHFMVLPEPRFNSPAPLNFKISLSGIATMPPVFYGGSEEWLRDSINIDVGLMAMLKLTNRIGALLPPLPMNGTNSQFGFVPLQWIVYGTFNSAYSPVSINHQGDSVDDWKIIREYERALDSNIDVQVFKGLTFDVAVRSGYIFKVGYEVNMYGYFVIYALPKID